MRIAFTFLTLLLAVALIGCAGPERKLGRGINNITELVRGGEMRRSMEQTALWDGADAAYTKGFFHGLNRSIARTAVGVYEIVTFPIPSYGPSFHSTNRFYPDISVKNRSYPYGGLVLTEHPIYPASYKPALLSDSMFATDTALGFSGGDAFPFVPGSRFHIFDNY